MFTFELKFELGHRVDAAVEIGEQTEAGFCVLKPSRDPPASDLFAPYSKCRGRTFAIHNGTSYISLLTG